MSLSQAIKNLDKLIPGKTTAVEARPIILACLFEGIADADRRKIAPEQIRLDKVFGLLQGLTWSALNDRRRDDADLVHWYNMIRGFCGLFSRTAPKFANQLEVLHQLLYQSYRVQTCILDDDDYFTRRFVKDIIRKVRASGSRLCSHGELIAAVTKPNPVIVDVAIARLVASSILDRLYVEGEVRYRLTPEGFLAARQLPNANYVATVVRDRLRTKQSINWRTQRRIDRRHAEAKVAVV